MAKRIILMIMLVCLVSFGVSAGEMNQMTYQVFNQASVQQVTGVGVIETEEGYQLRMIGSEGELTEEIILTSVERLIQPKLTVDGERIFVSYVQEVNGQFYLYLVKKITNRWVSISGATALNTRYTAIEQQGLVSIGQHVYVAYTQNRQLHLLRYNRLDHSRTSMYQQPLGTEEMAHLTLLERGQDLVFAYTQQVTGQMNLHIQQVGSDQSVREVFTVPGITGYDLNQLGDQLYLAYEVQKKNGALVYLLTEKQGSFYQIAETAKEDVAPFGVKLLMAGGKLGLLYREQGFHANFDLYLKWYQDGELAPAELVDWDHTPGLLTNLNQNVQEIDQSTVLLTSGRWYWKGSNQQRYQMIDLEQTIPYSLWKKGLDQKKVNPVAIIGPEQKNVRNINLMNPMGMVTDGEQNLYALDGGQVRKFDATGQLVDKWILLEEQEVNLTDLVIDQEGEFLVVDSRNNRILRVDPRGEVVAEFGGEGVGPGQFNHPTSIAIDSEGQLYVVDQGNQRLQKFDPHGRYITEWGSLGTAPGQFDQPTAITIDGQDQIYVADTGNHRVQVFQSNGIYLKLIGAWGIDGAQMIRPVDLAISQGMLYVADQGNDRIQVFSSELEYQYELGQRGGDWGQFSQLSSLYIDQQGNIFVSDQGNYTIQKIDQTQTVLFGWHGGEEMTTLSLLEKVDTIGQTRYYWSEKYQRLMKYNDKMDFLGAVALDNQGRILTGFTMDQDHFYLIDRLNQSVVIYDQQGQLVQTIGGYGHDFGQFVEPEGIALDDAGNLYVADTGNQRIQQFDPQGQWMQSWGQLGLQDGQFIDPVSITYQDSKLLVADLGLDRVQEFTTQGEFQKQLPKIGEAEGQLSVYDYLQSDIQDPEAMQLFATYDYGLSNDTTKRLSKTWYWTDRWGYGYRYSITNGYTTTPSGDFKNISSASKSGVSGKWYLNIQAKGTFTTYSTGHYYCYLDNSPPSLSMPTAPSEPARSFSFSWNAYDNYTYSTDIKYRYRISERHPNDWDYDEELRWANEPIGYYKSTTVSSGNGRKFLVVSARDNLYNSVLKTIEFTIDNSAPSITGLSSSTTPVKSKTWNWSGSDYYTSNSEIQFRYLVSSYKYSSLTSRSYSTGYKSASTPSGASGTYYLNIQAKDKLGNETPVYHYSVVLDNSAPVLYPDRVSVSDHLSNSTITVSIPSDAYYDTYSNVSVYYRLKSTDSFTAYTGSFSVSDEIDYQLDIKLVDTLGNTRYYYDVNSFRIDKTPPDMDINGVIFEGIDLRVGEETNQDVIVTVPSSSYFDASGVAKVEYTTDGTSGYQVYTGPVTYTEERGYQLSVRLTDNAGNAKIYDIYQFSIDKTPPVLYTDQVSVDSTGFISGTDISTGSVTITIPSSSYYDPKGGIAKRLYRLKSTDSFQTFSSSSPITVNADGNYDLEIKLVDYAGNTAIFSVKSFTIDKTDPYLSKSAVDFDNTNLVTGTTDLYNPNVTITIPTSAYSDLTGISEIMYRTKSTAGFQAYTGAFTVSGDGDYQLEVRLTDGAGHTKTYVVDNFVIDTTPPSLDSSQVTFTSLGTTGVADIYSDDVTVTIPTTAYSDANPVTGIYYRIKTTEAFQPYTGPFTISNEGTYQVEVKLEDAAENSQVYTVKNMTLDWTSPVLTVENIIPSVHYSTTWTAEQSGSFVLNATDNICDINKFYYLVSFNPTESKDLVMSTGLTSATNTIQLSGLVNGIQYLHIVPEDVAGNAGTPAHYQIMVANETPAQPVIQSDTHTPLGQTTSLYQQAHFYWETPTAGLEGVVGITDYEYKLVKVVNNVPTILVDESRPVNEFRSAILPVLTGVDDHYEFHLVAVNGVGKKSTPAIFEFKVGDASAVDQVSVFSSTHAGSDRYYAASSLNYTWVDPADTGTSQYFYRFGTETELANLSWQTVSTAQTTVGVTQSGSYQFQAKNLHGTVEKVSPAKTVLLDLVEPEITDFQVTLPMVISSTPTDNQVIVSWGEASDLGGSNLAKAQARLLITNGMDRGWIQADPSQTNQIILKHIRPGVDYTLKFELRDQAGNSLTRTAEFNLETGVTYVEGQDLSNNLDNWLVKGLKVVDPTTNVGHVEDAELFLLPDYQFEVLNTDGNYLPANRISLTAPTIDQNDIITGSNDMVQYRVNLSGYTFYGQGLTIDSNGLQLHQIWLNAPQTFRSDLNTDLQIHFNNVAVSGSGNQVKNNVLSATSSTFDNGHWAIGIHEYAMSSTGLTFTGSMQKMYMGAPLALNNVKLNSALQIVDTQLVGEKVLSLHNSLQFTTSQLTFTSQGISFSTGAMSSLGANPADLSGVTIAQVDMDSAGNVQVTPVADTSVFSLNGVNVHPTSITADGTNISVAGNVGLPQLNLNMDISQLEITHATGAVNFAVANTQPIQYTLFNDWTVYIENIVVGNTGLDLTAELAVPVEAGSVYADSQINNGRVQINQFLVGQDGMLDRLDVQIPHVGSLTAANGMTVSVENPGVIVEGISLDATYTMQLAFSRAQLFLPSNLGGGIVTVDDVLVDSTGTVNWSRISAQNHAVDFGSLGTVWVNDISLTADNYFTFQGSVTLGSLFPGDFNGLTLVVDTLEIDGVSGLRTFSVSPQTQATPVTLFDGSVELSLANMTITDSLFRVAGGQVKLYGAMADLVTADQIDLNIFEFDYKAGVITDFNTVISSFNFMINDANVTATVLELDKDYISFSGSVVLPSTMPGYSPDPVVDITTLQIDYTGGLIQLEASSTSSWEFYNGAVSVVPGTVRMDQTQLEFFGGSVTFLDVMADTITTRGAALTSFRCDYRTGQIFEFTADFTNVDFIIAGSTVGLTRISFTDQYVSVAGDVTLPGTMPGVTEGHQIQVKTLTIDYTGTLKLFEVTSSLPFLLYNGTVELDPGTLTIDEQTIGVADGYVKFVGDLATKTFVDQVTLNNFVFDHTLGKITAFSATASNIDFTLLKTDVHVSDLHFNETGFSLQGSVTLNASMPGEWSSKGIAIESLAMDYTGAVQEFRVRNTAPIYLKLHGLNLSFYEIGISSTGFMMSASATLADQAPIPENLRNFGFAINNFEITDDFQVTDFSVSALDVPDFNIGQVAFSVESLTFTKSQFGVAGRVTLPGTFPGDLAGNQLMIRDFSMDYHGKVLISDIEVKTFSFDVGNFIGARVDNLRFTVTDGLLTMKADTGSVTLNRFDQTVSFKDISMDTNGGFSANLSSMELDVAGTQLEVNNAVFTSAGVSATSGQLLLPSSLGGAGLTVYDVKITKENGLQIGDGVVAFNFPTIKIGSGAAKTELKDVRMELGFGSDFYFTGTGSAFVPGTGEFEAEISLQTRTSDLPSGIKRIYLKFTSSRLGIPIGSTGLYINGVSGEFEDGPIESTAPYVVRRLGDGMRFSLRVYVRDAINNLKGSAGFWISISNLGNAAIDGELEMLNGLVEANVAASITNHFRDFYAEAYIYITPVEGDAYFRIWEDDHEAKLAGGATVRVTIPRGKVVNKKIRLGFTKIRVVIPSSSWTSPDVGVEFGMFTNGARGVKGYVEVPLFGEVGFYAGNEGFKLRGVDEYVLIDSASAQIQPLFFDPTVTTLELALQSAELGNYSIGNNEYIGFTLEGQKKRDFDANQLLSADQVQLEDYFVPSTQRLVFVVGYDIGDPDVVAVGPDGRRYTKDTVGVQYTKEANQIAISIPNPDSGTWYLELDEIKGINYQVSILGSTPEPELVIEDTTLTADQKILITGRGGVFTGASSYVDLYYDTDGMNSDGMLIAERVPLVNNTFSYEWNPVQIPTGEYRIYGKIYDEGGMPATISYADSVSTVYNNTPIISPSQIDAVRSADHVQVKWDEDSNPNVSGYMVYYGNSSGTYDSSLDVGYLNNANFTFSALENCYLTVVAYDELGVESTPVTEVMLPAGEPPVTVFNLADATIPAEITMYIGEGQVVEIPYVANGLISGTSGDYFTVSLEGLPNTIAANVDQPFYNMYAQEQALRLSLFSELEDIYTQTEIPELLFKGATPGQITGQMVFTSVSNPQLQFVKDLTLILEYRQPLLREVTPDEGLNTQVQQIVLQGEEFRVGAQVLLGTTELTVISVKKEEIVAEVPAGFQPGLYDLTVVNNDGKSSLLVDAYTVLEPEFTLEKLQEQVVIPMGLESEVHLLAVPWNEFSGTVTIQPDLAPQGLWVEQKTETVTIGSQYQQVSFRVGTAQAVIPGTYQLSFIGTSGTMTRRMDIAVQIIDPAADPTVSVPTIHGFDRPFGITTQSIRIYGVGFGTSGNLYLNDQLIPVTEWQNHKIDFVVPADATTGNLVVESGGQQSVAQELIVKNEGYTLAVSQDRIVMNRDLAETIRFFLTGYSQPIDFRLENVPYGLGYQFLGSELGIVPNYTLECTFNALKGIPNGEYDLELVGVTEGQETRIPFTVVITDTPQIENVGLAEGRVGLYYEDWIDVKLGVAPYLYQVVDNSLPLGLSISKTGMISGIPQLPGQNIVTVQVTDAANQVVKRDLELNILSNEWIYAEYDQLGSNHTLTPGPATNQLAYEKKITGSGSMALTGEEYLILINGQVANVYSKDHGDLVNTITASSTIVDAVVTKTGLILLEETGALKQCTFTGTLVEETKPEPTEVQLANTLYPVDPTDPITVDISKGNLYLYRDRVVVLRDQLMEVRYKQDLLFDKTMDLSHTYNNTIKGVLREGILYYVTGDQQVVGLNLETHQVVVNVGFDAVITDLVGVNNGVLLLKQTGEVVLLDQTGATSLLLNYSKPMNLVIPYAEGYLVGDGTEVNLYGFDGTLSQSIVVNYQKLLIAGDRLYLANAGAVESYKLLDLTQVWSYPVINGQNLVISQEELYAMTDTTLYKFGQPIIEFVTDPVTTDETLVVKSGTK